MNNTVISTKRYRKEKMYKEKQHASRYRTLLKELLGITSKRDTRYIRLSPMCGKSNCSTCGKNTHVSDRRRSRHNLRKECREMSKEFN